MKCNATTVICMIKFRGDNLDLVNNAKLQASSLILNVSKVEHGGSRANIDSLRARC